MPSAVEHICAFAVGEMFSARSAAERSPQCSSRWNSAKLLDSNVIAQYRLRMAISPLEKLRALCLALPEAHEVEAWGAPTFRVKNKLFAMYSAPENQHGAERHGVWLHCAPENQRALVEMDPARYFVPPYVGKSGWVGVWIDKRPRWTEVERLVRDAYVRVAPKKLGALVG